MLKNYLWILKTIFLKDLLDLVKQSLYIIFHYFVVRINSGFDFSVDHFLYM